MTERDKCLYYVSRFVEFVVLSHVCVFLKKMLCFICRNPWSIAIDFVPVDSNWSVVLHGGEESD